MKKIIGLLIVIALVSSASQNKVETPKTASLSGKIENHGPTVLKIMDFFGKSAWTDRISAEGNLFITNESLDQELLQKLIFDSELRNRLINNWAVTYKNELTELAELNAATIGICKNYLQEFKN